MMQGALKFAPEKNEGILLTRRKRTREINLHLVDGQIRTVKGARYLSIPVNRILSGLLYVRSAMAKSSKVANARARILSIIHEPSEVP